MKQMEINSINKHKNEIIQAVFVTVGLSVCFSSFGKTEKKDRPNFIIILTDDQGYNDLGCYGSKTIRTPNIDRMAQEGMKLTNFYAQTVSGPSRGALMTGRYPARIGSGWIVNPEELTIAENLKNSGYVTGCIGKWDMSGRKDSAGYVPNDQGFDYYFGTLGATDRGVVQIFLNREPLYITNEMSKLTSMYTDEAINFIEKNSDTAFFLYLAHSMPHTRIDASAQFKGKSKGELYGDVVEEIDWNVGRLLDTVRKLGLDKNTYVIYMSDNGPWSGAEKRLRTVHKGQLASGSAFPLRSGKGSPYEGGFREPCIIWAPGRIPAGVIKDGIMSSLDIFPTFTRLAGAHLPDDRIYDGIDQTAFIKNKSASSSRKFFYYHVRGEIQAVRYGDWKLLIPNTTMKYWYTNDPVIKNAELYNLKNDISEKTNLADEYPGKVKRLLLLADKAPENLDILNP